VIIWGGAILGIYLLVSGDTVDRFFGIGLLAAAAVFVAITIWVYWKALRLLRRGAR
jgi:hypothetical protein